MSSFRHRLAALLAIVAITFQAFLPLLAEARSGDLLSSTLCSADGTVRTVDIPGVPQGPGGAGKHVKHCALCTSAGDRAAQAIDAPATPSLLVSDAALQLPAAEHAAPSCTTVVSPAHPRAPPVQS